MAKKHLALITLIIIILLFSAFFLIMGFSQKNGTGGLQVTANTKSKVFLNGKDIGSAPLCKCDQDNTLKVGEYTLKIVPEDQSLTPFEYKIKIQKNVMTVIDRTFLPGAYSSAYLLYLEKSDSQDAQLLVVSLPDGALVTIDGNPNGITPFLLRSVSPSEHEVEITKQGFSKKTIKIKAVPSYKLIINAILGTKVETADQAPIASAAANINTLPLSQNYKIKINGTPNGFLRVRENPGTSFKEINRVKEGAVYSALDEKNNWFKIQLNDGGDGWISGDYIVKITN